ncbi:MAG TPA: mechanosensitive ion channel domain-containing protein [Gemmatimonadales bacterium]|nr:mechanosensitive ion channel domain-containing protein [Gemmatimonadales bacterium]
MNEQLQAWLTSPAMIRTAIVAGGIVIIVTVVRLLQRAATGRIESVDARYRMRKLIALFGWIAAFLLVIGIFSGRFSQVTVALGVAGAGIAFALQEVIASFAGWLAITFGDFYAPGDRVQLGGIKGDVIDIGVLRTTLMECGQWVEADLYNGRIVRVANSFVFKEPVFNYSADFPFLWDEIRVPVRYGSDHAEARRLIERTLQEVVGEYAEFAKESWREMVRKYRIEAASVEPMVTLIANDNWLEFTARYVVDYKLRRSTKDRIFTRLLEAVAATNGAVELASATFELSRTPVVDVRVRPA